jgi:Kelch motif
MEHTATLLRTGAVMIVGGDFLGGTNLRTVEFFNPATQEWVRGPDMSTPRSLASQTLLRWDRYQPLELKVLVAGGRSSDSGTNTLDSAELFTAGEVNV